MIDNHLDRKEIAKLIRVEDVVDFIEVLFDHQLPKDILFETSAEIKLVGSYRNFYRALRVWLEHLVLKKRLAPEAILTDWKYYQPHAELADANLVLMAGVHSRSDVYNRFEQPYHAWGSLLVYQCKEIINGSGLLGIPVIHGKAEAISHNLARTKEFDSGEISLKPPTDAGWSKLTVHWHESPLDYLVATAVELAKDDPDFDEQYWLPYKRRVNLWRRKIRNCKEIGAAYILPGGEMFVTGKNQKIPKKYKGFGGCTARNPL